MNEILSIQGLSKSYKSVRAIRSLNLQILEGQAYGILGPNGSGKTTTLSIVTGIIRQDAGSFSWFGEPPAAGQRKAIGSLIETPHFYPYLNLEKNLRIICDIKAMDYRDIHRVLQTAKLFERRRSKFSTLSLGMKQRLGIAAALLGDPRVLVLDEPTNGLDPEGIAEVREVVLEQVKLGKTLILASHILSEVEKICNHVAILKKGELLANGPVKELLAEDEIIIFTPYFIPGKAGLELINEVRARGVRIVLVTNSLATNNHTSVYSAYSKYRKPVLEAGVELWEARGDAAMTILPDGTRTQEHLTLHTKGIIIDRRYAFVGSLNLDPRSIDINTEMGVIIDSKPMSEGMARRALEGVPPMAYRVQLNDKGKVTWHATIDGKEVVETKAPQTSAWLRFKAWFLKIAPEKQL